MRDVQLHSIPLDQMAARQAGLARLLSPDELARAARFHFPRDRSRFILCRGRLREILSAHLKKNPAEIEFTYNARGKPETAGVHFNLSHSGGFAIVAVSAVRRIGVDIERIDARFAHENIPERFFSPGEVVALRSLPDSAQLDAFFKIWTRKEAYIKALGAGLSHPLASFDALAGVEGWEIESLDIAPGYAAAVAAALIEARW